MEDVNHLLEGVKFMFLGMGTVFLFLIIMIWAMILQTKIITKFFPQPMVTPEAPKANQTNKNAKVAAIAAAIMHHRNSQG
jgi:oxaloacetate decarboxylase (Na+ extruding) subunit gamma